MVVTQKKKDNRGAVKSSVSSLPGVEDDQQKRFVPLVKTGFERERGGPSTKGLEGKRKAQAKIRLSPSSPTRSLNLPSSISGEPACMSSGQVFSEGANRDNSGVIKTKPKSNSVKGKKEVARARHPQHSPISAANLRDNVLTPSVWFASISALKTEVNGEFIFGVNSNNNVGDLCVREDHGNAEKNSRRNSGSSNMHIKFNNGVTPSDRHNLGTEERPEVGISLKHAGSGESKKIGLEYSAKKFCDSDSLQSESGGKIDSEEDDGTHHRVQSTLNCC